MVPENAGLLLDALCLGPSKKDIALRGPTNPHKRKDLTFWFQGPISGGMPETTFCRRLTFMWSLGADVQVPCKLSAVQKQKWCEYVGGSDG